MSTKKRIGSGLPPIGKVPETMLAQVIRRRRYGNPMSAFAVEEVPVPRIGPDECLVYVMAAGINYNGVWASFGHPVDVVATHRRDGDMASFHIGGSDASGIVWLVGDAVQGIAVGDEVVVHCGWWPRDAIADAVMDPRARIWGFDVNYGSFAQFTKVQAHSLLPKPPRLSWEAAAAYMLCGATAYRMLFGFDQHAVRRGDVVLVWGGSGGIGSMAIQLARDAGGIPVAVVSSRDREDYCCTLGAAGVIDRTRFDHWGPLPAIDDRGAYRRWRQRATAFRRAIWEAIGEHQDPRIVIEHPGENSLPTSCFVCQPGGMVVICAGTTGYHATFDLRYHWLNQKRLQGSHFANDIQCATLNALVDEGRVQPCLGHIFEFEEIPLAHQLMYENRGACGNSVARVGAWGSALR